MKNSSALIFFHLICLFMVRNCYANPIDELVSRMVNKKTAWEERCEAEDTLLKANPHEVVLKLRPYVGWKISVGINNSGGREHDKNASVEWQIYYAVGRIWSNRLAKLSPEERVEFLLASIRQSNRNEAKKCFLWELWFNWTPTVEQEISAILHKADADISLRITAAWLLNLSGRENYQSDILTIAEASDHEQRIEWFKLLTEGLYKNKTGVDPRVIRIGFDLIEVELRSAFQNQAADIANRIGTYVGLKISPNLKDSIFEPYPEKYYETTVNNAILWWEQHKKEILKQSREPAVGR